MAAGTVAAALLATGTAEAAVTRQCPNPPTRAAGSYDYYLALGDSLAWGDQPNSAGADSKSGHGYADDLAEHLRGTDRSLKYVNLACPGDTTGTMLDGGCPLLALSGQSYTVQVDAAVAFLKAHLHARTLVTLSIGANDVDDCATGGSLDATCVAQGLAEVGVQLPQILADLEGAAGPQVSFVGTDYYDPFLADWLTGADGQTVAEESVALSTTFSGILDTAYGAYGIPVADVSGAFRTADFTDTTTLDGATVPVNVANICTLTWMCAPAPVGPNIHPNDAGYRVITQAVEAELPAD